MTRRSFFARLAAGVAGLLGVGAVAKAADLYALPLVEPRKDGVTHRTVSQEEFLREGRNFQSQFVGIEEQWHRLQRAGMKLGKA